MANLGQMLDALREERRSLLSELVRIDGAIRAVSKLTGSSSGQAKGGRKRRVVSAATRRKIAAAQKARWARVKKEKKEKGA